MQFLKLVRKEDVIAMRETAATVEDTALNPWVKFNYEENVCGSEGFGHGKERGLLLRSPVLPFLQWGNKKIF